jgi:hypothetical protein
MRRQKNRKTSEGNHAAIGGNPLVFLAVTSGCIAKGSGNDAVRFI